MKLLFASLLTGMLFVPSSAKACPVTLTNQLNALLAAQQGVYGGGVGVGVDPLLLNGGYGVGVNPLVYSGIDPTLLLGNVGVGRFGFGLNRFGVGVGVGRFGFGVNRFGFRRGFGVGVGRFGFGRGIGLRGFRGGFRGRR